MGAFGSLLLSIILLNGPFALSGSEVLVDRFQYNNLNTRFYRIQRAPWGDYFVGGVATDDKKKQTTWVIRQSDSSGIRWRTSDAFLLDSGYSGGEEAPPMGFVFTSTREVLVAGSAYDAAKRPHFVVRRSPDRGKSWSTIDQFLIENAAEARLFNLIREPRTGDLYYSGWVETSSSNFSWIVRQSRDNGRRWKTVDRFVGAHQGSISRGITYDSVGNIYAYGLTDLIKSPGIKLKMLVRVSPDRGRTWKSLELKGADGNIEADGLVRDRSGLIIASNIFGPLTWRWEILRWSTGKMNPKILDTYQPNAKISEVQDFHVRGSSYFASGFASGSGDEYHQVIRLSKDSGETWRTILDVNHPGKDFVGYGLSVDKKIVVVGAERERDLKRLFGTTRLVHYRENDSRP